MNSALIITTIAGIIKTAVELTPTVIKTIEDAKPFAEAIYNNLVKGNVITKDQLLELEAHILELSNQLQAPVPNEERTSSVPFGGSGQCSFLKMAVS